MLATMGEKCIEFDVGANNRKTYKRLIIPYVGVIHFTWIPFNIKRKIKSFLGIKAMKKLESFFCEN